MNTRVTWIVSASVIALLAVAYIFISGERSITRAAGLMPNDHFSISDESMTRLDTMIPITATDYHISLPIIIKNQLFEDHERGALIALYNSTDGDHWGTKSAHD
jgi:hypothetical protein